MLPVTLTILRRARLGYAKREGGSRTPKFGCAERRGRLRHGGEPYSV